jgi:hypothetical protein
MVLVSVFPHKRPKYENGDNLNYRWQTRRWSWFDYQGFHHIAWTTERVGNGETLANQESEGDAKPSPDQSGVRLAGSALDGDLREVD